MNGNSVIIGRFCLHPIKQPTHTNRGAKSASLQTAAVPPPDAIHPFPMPLNSTRILCLSVFELPCGGTLSKYAY